MQRLSLSLRIGDSFNTQVIPAYEIDITGFDNVWELRKSKGEDPLDVHSQHSSYVNGSTVVALSTVYGRR